MSTTLANLVHQTTTTTGTGNLTVTAVNGKQSFDTAFGHAATTDVFDYFISSRDAAEWERGTGHMSTSSVLVRDTVLESSNANAAVSFTAGTKDVTCDLPASKMARIDVGQTFVGNQLISGTLGVSSDFAVNTNKFTVTASNGNTAVAGTLSVTGAGTFGPGTGSQILTINAGTSSGDGASIWFKGGGTLITAIGTASSILGGTYDADFIFYVGSEKMRVNSSGLTLRPGGSITPAHNGDLVFESTGNTNLNFKLKGNDGTVRTASLVLA